MVDLDEIRAFEHVHQARRFCSCMRVGVFATVADLDIWRALENMRDASKYPKAEDYLVEEIEIPPTLIWLSQQKDSR
jgi:hypothetical protein